MLRSSGFLTVSDLHDLFAMTPSLERLSFPRENPFVQMQQRPDVVAAARAARAAERGEINCQAARKMKERLLALRDASVAQYVERRERQRNGERLEEEAARRRRLTIVSHRNTSTGDRSRKAPQDDPQEDSDFNEEEQHFSPHHEAVPEDEAMLTFDSVSSSRLEWIRRESSPSGSKCSPEYSSSAEQHQQQHWRQHHQPYQQQSWHSHQHHQPHHQIPRQEQQGYYSHDPYRHPPRPHEKEGWQPERPLEDQQMWWHGTGRGDAGGGHTVATAAQPPQATHRPRQSWPYDRQASPPKARRPRSVGVDTGDGGDGQRRERQQETNPAPPPAGSSSSKAMRLRLALLRDASIQRYIDKRRHYIVDHSGTGNKQNPAAANLLRTKRRAAKRTAASKSDNENDVPASFQRKHPLRVRKDEVHGDEARTATSKVSDWLRSAASTNALAQPLKLLVVVTVFDGRTSPSHQDSIQRYKHHARATISAIRGSVRDIAALSGGFEVLTRSGVAGEFDVNAAIRLPSSDETEAKTGDRSVVHTKVLFSRSGGGWPKQERLARKLLAWLSAPRADTAKLLGVERVKRKVNTMAIDDDAFDRQRRHLIMGKAELRGAAHGGCGLSLSSKREVRAAAFEQLLLGGVENMVLPAMQPLNADPPVAPHFYNTAADIAANKAARGGVVDVDGVNDDDDDDDDDDDIDDDASDNVNPLRYWRLLVDVPFVDSLRLHYDDSHKKLSTAQKARDEELLTCKLHQVNIPADTRLILVGVVETAASSPAASISGKGVMIMGAAAPPTQVLLSHAAIGNVNWYNTKPEKGSGLGNDFGFFVECGDGGVADIQPGHGDVAVLLERENAAQRKRLSFAGGGGGRIGSSPALLSKCLSHPWKEGTNVTMLQNDGPFRKNQKLAVEAVRTVMRDSISYEYGFRTEVGDLLWYLPASNNHKTFRAYEPCETAHPRWRKVIYTLGAHQLPLHENACPKFLPMSEAVVDNDAIKDDDDSAVAADEDDENTVVKEMVQAAANAALVAAAAEIERARAVEVAAAAAANAEVAAAEAKAAQEEARARRECARMERSAVKVQSRWRRRQSRSRVQALRQARRLVRRRFVERVSASRLQAVVRERLRRRAASAVTLQALARRRSSRRSAATLRRLREAAEAEAARVLVGFSRRRLARVQLNLRRKARRLEQETTAALNLQRVARGRIGRLRVVRLRRERNAFLWGQKNDATATIQRSVRRRSARRVLERRRAAAAAKAAAAALRALEDRGANRIQSALRRSQARRELRERRERRRAELEEQEKVRLAGAAVMLQGAVRKLRAVAERARLAAAKRAAEEEERAAAEALRLRLEAEAEALAEVKRSLAAVKIQRKRRQALAVRKAAALRAECRNERRAKLIAEAKALELAATEAATAWPVHGRDDSWSEVEVEDQEYNEGDFYEEDQSDGGSSLETPPRSSENEAAPAAAASAAVASPSLPPGSPPMAMIPPLRIIAVLLIQNAFRTRREEMEKKRRTLAAANLGSPSAGV